jgi:integrase
VAKSLKVLRHLCRFASSYRKVDGRFLLEGDPTRGLPIPSEPNPKRPVVDSERLDRLLEVADKVQMRDSNMEVVPSYLYELLVLAAGTGRRIGAILALRWEDWDPDKALHGTLRWRAESDKLKRDWLVPVTAEVRAVFEGLRKKRPGVGAACVFADPVDPSKPISQQRATRWLRRAEELAELDHLPGGGWHAFRRMWATARKDHPLKDVAFAGGWRDTQTLLKCYQHHDPETLERVVSGAKRIKAG